MIIPDREHIVELSASEVAYLRDWMAEPNGAARAHRVTLEAVEGGGILVRTQPYRYPDLRTGHER